MKEKRRSERFNLRLFLQYERALENGTFAFPITCPAHSISSSGIAFFCDERMSMYARLRITVAITDDQKVGFLVRIVRMEIAQDGPAKFLIGATVESIDSEGKRQLDEFISGLNIYRIIDGIDLEGVVDIHFVAGYPPVIKKIGKMVISKAEPIPEGILRELLLNILDEQRYKEFIETKEANFVFLYKGDIRFRVNLHMQQGKVEAVFRLIPRKVALPSELGLPKAVENMSDHKKGLIIVSGRTGSGKTTTLSSIVEYINSRRDCIIISIEKPIEYLHTNIKSIIKQREVGRDTLSFSNAARNALRQNPDVLIIGEILDMETMEVAITAAETGMLVLTSIHAGEASQALDRVASFFSAELQKHMLTRLSLILLGVIAQNLIPRKDGKGLIVATEILAANNALRRVMREGDWKQIPSVIMSGKSLGMQTMRQCLEDYFQQDLIESEYLAEFYR
ncbi:type IV pilus twitching motility protein PilT [Candidatus Omnitrophota bacterium]